MSICPSAGNGKSWKLPPNTGDGSYTNLFLTKTGLVTAISGTNATFVNTIQAKPYGFVLSGTYSDTSRYQGRGGFFWSRSAYESDGRYSHSFDFYRANDAEYPGNFALRYADRKYVGRAVRCSLSLASSGKIVQLHPQYILISPITSTREEGLIFSPCCTQ